MPYQKGRFSGCLSEVSKNTMNRYFAMSFVIIIFLLTACSYKDEPEIAVFKNTGNDANYYLISQNGRGVLIDAGGCLEEIAEYVDTNKMKVEAIILTHNHSDHVMEAADLKERLKSKLMISKKETDFSEGFDPIKADVYLDGDQTLDIAGISFDIINTPGHSPGSISIKMDSVVFTGDTLFWDTIGSVHYGGGDYDEILSSIRNKLLTLDDDTTIYPGHGPSCSIGYVRENNVFMK